MDVFCTDVSRTRGAVSITETTRTRINILTADFQGLKDFIEFRYAMGCREDKNLCLAITVVINIDEYRKICCKGSSI